ncbi:hypothetical protein ACHAPF_001341 [Botrytis cinerea]
MKSTSPTRTRSSLSLSESLFHLSLTILCVSLLLKTLSRENGEPLIASLAFSGLAFSATYSMIRWLGPTFMKAGLKGKDMSKRDKKEIPETMGAVCAVLASYLSAVLSLQSVVILGIGDDLFDIRWRHKFFIPAIASIPILIVYFVDFGVTQIVIPIPLQPYLGELFQLGPLYYIYMASIAIFCPNSINILAGINGIEVSQSLIIAFLLVLNDTLYLLTPYPHPATDSHLFSLYMLLPFIGVSLALLSHNWYPSSVFVGDTYCYFAGMVFAICGILGHFSKTLLLLLIPQTFNFLYSVPQLFHLIPCPRHRLPYFNAKTNLLEPSITPWPSPPKKHQLLLLSLLHKFYLIDLKFNSEGEIIESSNFTLLNLWLVWFGPRREDRLAMEILGMQMVCGLIGLFVRHRLALLIFKSDNLSV